MIKTCKDHLDSVNESYLQHLIFAFKFGGRCLKAGLMAILHGICPAFCKTAASDEVKDLYALLCACRAQKEKNDAAKPSTAQSDNA